MFYLLIFSSGKCYFRGPWFIKPYDIPNTKNKLFYKQEIFLSSLEDTHPIVSIIGKCTVLEYNDYIMCEYGLYNKFLVN